jgi:hypothetical protein
MNKIKALVIWGFGLAKKAISWGTDVHNLETIQTQLSLINMGAKFLGKRTKYKAFADVADVTTSIAKTLDDIMDGHEEKSKKKFLKAVNKDKKELKGLNVEVDSKAGIGINFKGLGGSYNPKDGSVKLGIKI